MIVSEAGRGLVIGLLGAGKRLNTNALARVQPDEQNANLKQAPAIEANDQKRRKYPRHKAPKGMFVVWKTAGQRTVSRAETVGVGGLFLHTPTPLPVGAFIELLFDLKNGEIRARATVRHSAPGRGMGIQFVQMQPADRARLQQFLSKFASGEALSGTDTPTSGGNAAAKQPEAVQFKRELFERLEIARKGNYYELFGVPPESSIKQIKDRFYALVRRFHPDHHMDERDCLPGLKELTAAITAAYKTLSDQDKRASYDLQLSESGAFQLRRAKTAAQQNLEEYLGRASEHLRANNFTGSVIWLRKCVEIAPGEAKYRALLARSLATIPQYRDEAIEHFEWALQLDPWNLNVLGQFAELYEEMQMPLPARKLYAKILEIDPHHTKARARLAELETKRTA